MPIDHTQPAMAIWEDAENCARLVIWHMATLPTTPEDEATLKAIIANHALTIIVSGYAAYCEQRFIELIASGYPVDIASLDRKLVPTEKQGALAAIPDDMVVPSVAYAQLLVLRYRINFQDFTNCKRAYNAAFGIPFGTMGLSGAELDELQQFLIYRHRIIHISPRLATLNLDESPPALPIYADEPLLMQAITIFGRFVDAVQTQTSITLQASSTEDENTTEL